MKNFRESSIKIFTLVLALIITVAIVPNALATVTDLSEGGNSAPVAKDLEISTYKEVRITGNFQAVDPEGDMIEYKLITEPKKGAVEISEDGQFAYTPAEGKKGKDTFTYVAVDAMGNVSNEATVKIIIEKKSTNITYSDMDDNNAYYAALRLAEEGIFVGEVIGDKYFFNPDTVVTRGEFLAMCLNASGAEILEDITRTGFADDEEISSWLKPYVTTALMSGVIKGICSDEGNLIFAASEPVTVAQASVILNGVMDISDETSVETLRAETSASELGWAYQATINLSAKNIISGSLTDVYENEMTRADVAEMICNAIDEVNDVSSSKLLSWAQ